MNLFGAFAIGLFLGGGLMVYLWTKYIRDYTQDFVDSFLLKLNHRQKYILIEGLLRNYQDPTRALHDALGILIVHNQRFGPQKLLEFLATYAGYEQALPPDLAQRVESLRKIHETFLHEDLESLAWHVATLYHPKRQRFLEAYREAAKEIHTVQDGYVVLPREEVGKTIP